MNVCRKRKPRVESLILSVLLVSLAVSGIVVFKNISSRSRILQRGKWKEPKRTARSKLINVLAIKSFHRSVPVTKSRTGLFTGELRVAAIGSAYPIPYDAEVCPFSNISQPSLNQLDRDGDGITDDWEIKHGLNRYNISDAQMDPDNDGFNNLEEFESGTIPRNAESHPPYAKKLRFVERKNIPFPLVFQGFTELSDGTMAFQLNAPATGKSHFASIGESVEGIVLQRFVNGSSQDPSRLYVTRGSSEIELVRGRIMADPESQALLINILDQSAVIATMGALLSLNSDEYTVLGVYPNKVAVQHLRTGEVFDIVGLADGKR